jgi:hypothetical protein
MVFGAGGMLAAVLLATAAAATAANAATGKTAAPSAQGSARNTSRANSPVTYERTGGTSWKEVASPEKGAAVTAAGAHLYQWDGTRWKTVKSLAG